MTSCSHRYTLDRDRHSLILLHRKIHLKNGSQKTQIHLWDCWRLWSATCITFSATNWRRRSICQSLTGCTWGLAEGREREREREKGWGLDGVLCSIVSRQAHSQDENHLKKKTWNFLFGASWVVLALSVSWSSEWSRPLKVWWMVCSVRDASLRLPDHYFSPWIAWRKRRDMLFVAHVSWCEPQRPLTWWGKNQWWTD